MKEKAAMECAGASSASFGGIVRLAVNRRCWACAAQKQRPFSFEREDEHDIKPACADRKRKGGSDGDGSSEEEGRPRRRMRPIPILAHGHGLLQDLQDALRLMAYRSSGDKEMTESAEHAANEVETSRGTLAAWSRIANTRTFFIIDALPQALRDHILVLLGPVNRSPGAICAAATHDHLSAMIVRNENSLSRIRDELSVALPLLATSGSRGHHHNNNNTTTARSAIEGDLILAKRTLRFMEEQPEIRNCIHAHRIAMTTCAAFAGMRLIPACTHRVCPCGSCTFEI